MIKILQHHSHFDMQPFFEWEFKFLPIMINWFTKATTRLDTSFVEKINKMKLSVTYDFIKEFPMLYIESVTRKEIAECAALEEKVHGDEGMRVERGSTAEGSCLEKTLIKDTLEEMVFSREMRVFN